VSNPGSRGEAQPYPHPLPFWGKKIEGRKPGKQPHTHTHKHTHPSAQGLDLPLFIATTSWKR